MIGLVTPEESKEITDAIKNEGLVEALIAYEYRPEPNELFVDIASEFEGGASVRSYFDEQAFDLAAAISLAYWGEPVQEYAVPEVLPTMRLVLDSQFEYVCSGPFMVRIANKEAGQQQFDAECRR